MGNKEDKVLNEVDVGLKRVRGWINKVGPDGQGRLAETARRMNVTFDPKWRADVSPQEAWAMCCAVWHTQQGRLDGIGGATRVKKEEQFLRMVANGTVRAMFEEEVLLAARAHFLHSRITEDNADRIFRMARAVAIVACKELDINLTAEAR